MLTIVSILKFNSEQIFFTLYNIHLTSEQDVEISRFRTDLKQECVKTQDRLQRPQRGIFVSIHLLIRYVYIYTNVGRVCSIRRRHQRPSSTSLYLGKGGCLLTCSLILKTLGLSIVAVLCDVTMTSRDRIQIRPFNIYYWQLEFAITYQMYRLFRRISFSRYNFQINSRESNSKYSAKIYMSHLQNLIYIISMVFHLYCITRC